MPEASRASGWIGLVVVALAHLALPAVGAAQDTRQDRVSITGTVVDAITEDSIPGVAVVLEGPDLRMQTDSKGRFTLERVPVGTYTLRVSHPAYRSLEGQFSVLREGEFVVRLSPLATGIDSTLTGTIRQPVELDPIEVSVERRERVLEAVGFYAREVDGFGEFIDRAEIEERSPGELTDLFSRIPGAQLVADPRSPTRKYVLMRGGRSDGCFPRVLLDGVIVHPGGRNPANLDDLVSPAIVAGIEAYPSSVGVPIQYGGTGSSCGVILLWTDR